MTYNTKLISIALLFCGVVNYVCAAPKEHNTALDISLSSEAEDAINSGVTLAIQAEYAIRNSYWFFSTSKKRKVHSFKIMRHTLSKRYVVVVDNETQPHIFRSINQASNYVWSRAHIIWESYADVEMPYAMRISLNHFELPAPMRLNAFISSAWELDTDWKEWQPVN